MLLYINVMLRTKSNLAAYKRMEPTLEEGKTKRLRNRASDFTNHIRNPPSLDFLLSETITLLTTQFKLNISVICSQGILITIFFAPKVLTFLLHFIKWLYYLLRCLSRNPKTHYFTLLLLLRPKSLTRPATWRRGIREREREVYYYSEVSILIN